VAIDIDSLRSGARTITVLIDRPRVMQAEPAGVGFRSRVPSRVAAAVR